MAWNDLDRITAEKLNKMDTGGIFADVYFISIDSANTLEVIGDFEKAFTKLSHGIPLVSYLFSKYGPTEFQLMVIFGWDFPISTDGTFIYFPINTVETVRWGINGADVVPR